jgi:hypothetical protein
MMQATAHDLESSNAGLLDSLGTEDLSPPTVPPPPRKFLMSRSNKLAMSQEGDYPSPHNSSSTPSALERSTSSRLLAAATSRRAASIGLALFLFVGGLVSAIVPLHCYTVILLP